MSRMPAFPTRRRSPSVTNGVSYVPSSAPGTSTTRPLQISRPGSRTTSPVVSSPYPPPNTAPLSPSRPRRSELRSRAEHSETERASISSLDPHRNRDSTSTSQSDNLNIPHHVPPKSANNMTTATSSRYKPQALDGDPTISSSSAFRSAGSKNPDEIDDYNYQRDRQLEIEAEKVRQQRIRDNGLGLRTKGNAKRGEIDGMSVIHLSSLQLTTDPNNILCE